MCIFHDDPFALRERSHLPSADSHRFSFVGNHFSRIALILNDTEHGTCYPYRFLLKNASIVKLTILFLIACRGWNAIII